MDTGVLEPGFHSPSRPTTGGCPSAVVGFRSSESTAARIASTPATSQTQCTRSGGTGGSVCPRSMPRAFASSAVGADDDDGGGGGDATASSSSATA
eukprot:11715-Pelagococcus_subviridis.AAC.1